MFVVIGCRIDLYVTFFLKKSFGQAKIPLFVHPFYPFGAFRINKAGNFCRRPALEQAPIWYRIRFNGLPKRQGYWILKWNKQLQASGD
jgi:hypothetical protein